jgi:hypothetical protein
MITTVYGNCSANGTPSQVHVLASAAGAVAVPIQTAPPSRQPAHHQHHTPAQARQPPQLTAQLTLAYLPSKAIDDGAGPVDQSPTSQFIHSTHNQRHQPTRQLLHYDRRSRPHHHPASASDATTDSAGLIHGYAQVTSYG